MTEQHDIIQPRPSRAIFSTEDFKLLQAAVAHYLPQAKDGRETAKYSHLHHRLGHFG